MIGRRARYLTLLLVLLGPAWRARPAAAQSAVGLGVQVINGTPDGGAVAGLPLTVYQISGDQQPVVVGRTDVQGAASWPTLGGPINARYVISTTYAGATYHTDPVTLSAPTPTLRVFEATGDDRAIHLTAAGLAILQVDPATQRIQVLESATLHNSGTRTFVPSTTGPRGPMGLLRFGLPDGAGSLTPDGRLAASTILQVTTGFATDLPVPPGDTPIAYSYELGYGALAAGGYALIRQDFPYAVDTLRVLVPQADYQASSPQLVPQAPTSFGSRIYRVLGGQNLAPHTEVALELRNLPLDQPVLRSSNPWLQGLVGGLLVIAVGLPVFVWRRYAWADGG